jgi:selenocysteine lyase/cysteine desulfurase
VTDSSVEFLPSPDRHQGGTPNIAGAIAYAEMLKYLSAIGMQHVREHELTLMKRAWPAMKAMPKITLYGPDALDERVGIITFNVEGVNDMLAAAVLGEEFGVAVRNGSLLRPRARGEPAAQPRRSHADGRCAPPSAVRASFGLVQRHVRRRSPARRRARAVREALARRVQDEDGGLSPTPATARGRCATHGWKARSD